MSFANEALAENVEFFINAIEKAKPSSAKGVYIKKITVSGAMTPGVQIKYVSAEAVAE
jgi:large subunit ribosomal protein L1